MKKFLLCVFAIKSPPKKISAKDFAIDLGNANVIRQVEQSGGHIVVGDYNSESVQNLGLLRKRIVALENQLQSLQDKYQVLERNSSCFERSQKEKDYKFKELEKMRLIFEPLQHEIQSIKDSVRSMDLNAIKKPIKELSEQTTSFIAGGRLIIHEIQEDEKKRTKELFERLEIKSQQKQEDYLKSIEQIIESFQRDLPKNLIEIFKKEDCRDIS